MGLNPSEIKSIEQLATDLKKWADNLPYSHSPTVVRLRPNFGQKKVITFLLMKMLGLGQKVEKEFNDLYDMIGEVNSWRTKSTATDDEFSEFQITVDQLKGATYDLAETLREIAHKGRQDLRPETPAETAQISTPPQRGRIAAILWKLYETTLGVIVDKILERLSPK